MVPKTTRRAFQPEIGTSNGSPRLPHAPRRGGNSSRSVSSSNNFTQRGGSAATSLRIRRFFLAPGVWVEHVARPLPNVPQVVELPANGGSREGLPTPVFQMLAQQRDRPLDSLIAKMLWSAMQGGRQRCL